ncbi:hypothetical protein ASPZODRAFT_135949 [Penicilliopsis zonata CBS 506.65]|uniref:NAD-dependent epimerase/dehydratase domain-containing protein n=1 Tax=Penicilliopsis zonata CBS 506.65 TaxID=1073090 RepID=A0A1L9S9T1_9EURO|nr:hypothetical protein ASPZODRAFT_135949 [Penicilliopsis zonata CBS 506.65]OJJ43908.1 hypothetical protein ASPZODRAFT_135949 [Penicilliopsis zonata CBS 506.65]
MSRILVTGGSGFLGGVVVDTLLARGHSVVTTVRSEEKAEAMRATRPDIAQDRLSFMIVKDIAKLDAFDAAVVSDPPFDVVVHTASPFHYAITDLQRDMLDPAVNGTVGILQSIVKHAPTVRRVVITSSFAAMYNDAKPAGSKYSEEDWNPVTPETALDAENSQAGYRSSKALAEKAAWKFVEKHKPSFTLSMINPSLIFGPVSASLRSLDEINTSNARIRDFILGKSKDKCPPTGSQFWVDVRDVALAHALAAEKPEAGGKRFFLTADNLCNADVVAVIAEEFPDLAAGLPSGDALAAGQFPPGGPKYGFDTSRSVRELGLQYRTLRESISDTVMSIQAAQNRLSQ